jgi:hypothetical protein
MLDEIRAMEGVPYTCGVGKVMYYYIATGPQISYIVQVLAQFMQNPERVHWEALKQLMQYMKGVKDRWMTLGGTDEGLEGFVDVDWGSQGD